MTRTDREYFNIWTRCNDPKALGRWFKSEEWINLDREKADQIAKTGNENAKKYGTDMEYRVVKVGMHPSHKIPVRT